MVNVLFKKEEEKTSMKEKILDFIKDIMVVIFIVLVIRAFFVAPFQIKGDSMDSNFYDKEFILVNRLSTINFPVFGEISPFERGDVVVFEPRNSKGKLINHENNSVKEEDDLLSKSRRFVAWPKITYIKRVVGLPGDTIRIEKGEVFLKKKGEENFVKLDENFLNDENYHKTGVFGIEGRKDFEVPLGKYFVMGDNRNNSSDSRICFSNKGCNGDFTPFVDEKYIIGKVWFDMGYFSLKKFDFIHPVKGIDTHPRFLDFPKTYNYNL